MKTPQSIIACDIDLGRIACFSSVTGPVCSNTDIIPWDALAAHELILVECASGLIYGPAAAKYNKTKWAIGNSFYLGLIAARFWEKTLVSPSVTWTLGHGEEMRENISGVRGKWNHDLRSAASMLYYYGRASSKWKPVSEFVSGLSKRASKKSGR